MAIIKVLLLGDIVSSMGVAAVRRALPSLREEFSLDAVIVNGENATGGIGLDSKTANDLLSLGVSCITLGDHTWSKKDLFPLLEEGKIIRPANYPDGAPGSGVTKITLQNGAVLGVVNLIGRVFFNQPLDCPFTKSSQIISSIKEVDIIIVDFHAEATSEKYAMRKYLDGKVSLIVGTHTHVQTSDEQISESGTGYITDLGMCGPMDGVIGMDAEVAVERFISGLPHSYKPAKGTPWIQGIVAEIDTATGKTESITRVRREVKI